MAHTSPNPFNGDALFADVQTYHDFGHHRTSTAADVATQNWLAERFASLGFDVQPHTYRFNSFTLDSCTLSLGDQTHQAFPLWFPKTTPTEGVTAQLIKFDPDTPLDQYHNKIIYIDAAYLSCFDWHKDLYQDFINHLTQSQHNTPAALLFEAPHPTGQIFAQNAQHPYRESPQPVSAALISTNLELDLKHALYKNLPATIQITGQSQPNTPAINTIAHLKRGPRHIIISTPTTAWFACAGERGSGVALFLALAQWASEQPTTPATPTTPTSHSYTFVATTGHELDNLGANHLHNANILPPPTQTDCWLHLGASIANRDWWIERAHSYCPSDRLNPINLVGSTDLLPHLQSAFAHTDYQPRTGEALGELHDIFERGYRAFGFYGRAHKFHTNHDTPDSTSPKLLEQTAIATAQALQNITHPTPRHL